MKRRDFVAAAAIAALYTPGLLAQTQENTNDKYFTLIEAKKEKVSKSNNSSLNAILKQESKDLLDLGYKQDSTFFKSIESSILFFPYSLNVNGLGCIDKQYIVIRITRTDEFEKITFLSQDFISAIDLNYSKMLSEFDKAHLKRMLLPVSRTSSFCLFKSAEAEVNFKNEILETKRKYTLSFQTPVKNYSFVTFNHSNNQIA